MAAVTRRACFSFALAAIAIAAPIRIAAAPGGRCPKPPRMTLKADGRRQRGRLGTYCWSEGEYGCCVDMIGELYPADALFISFGETPELDLSVLGPLAELSYEIRSVRLEIVDDGLSWKDTPGPEPTRRFDLIRPTSPVLLPDDLPHGLYVVGVFAAAERGGDTWQGFRLYVGPEPETSASGATPAAAPVATPVAAAAPAQR
ncbi:MAG: hypothetical protein IT337_04175 [Thermomicrobiales bacterium]|nr:hypothetical protein [Thermomicrobiales bacterium]